MEHWGARTYTHNLFTLIHCRTESLDKLSPLFFLQWCNSSEILRGTSRNSSRSMESWGIFSDTTTRSIRMQLNLSRVRFAVSCRVWQSTALHSPYPQSFLPLPRRPLTSPSSRPPFVAGGRSRALVTTQPASASGPVRRRRHRRWRCATSSRARTTVPRTARRRPTPLAPSPTPSSASHLKRRYDSTLAPSTTPRDQSESRGYSSDLQAWIHDLARTQRLDWLVWTQERFR
jgi:hypothetical protein